MSEEAQAKSDPTMVERSHLERWAEAAIRMDHLGTLVVRAIDGGDLPRARALAERARVAALAQGLCAIGKAPSEALAPAVWEKLARYGLRERYGAALPA